MRSSFMINVEFLSDRQSLFSINISWSSSIDNFINESEISFLFTFAYVLKLDILFFRNMIYF